ncbi:MAG: sulfatase-like hydrolase/transferase [Acidimicrobiales bacterium]
MRTTGRHIRRLALLGSLCVLAAGCQLWIPSPSWTDPVPDIQVSFSEPEPVSGTVDLTATVTGFVPTQVSFVVAGHPGLTIDDLTAPWVGSLDTTQLDDGSYQIITVATDGSSWLFDLSPIEVANRPNIVVIMADDLDETTTDYWAALTQTKTLIADQGITFDNTFATDPVCCPARATLLSGEYPHNTGVFDNTPPDGGLPAFQASGGEADTVAVRLQNTGYATALIGKYLAFYSNHTYIPPGWDEWFAFSGSNDYYDGYDYDVSNNGVLQHFGTTPADYQTDVLRDQALSVLDGFEANDDQPFFMWLTPTAPHLPLGPAPRHANHQWVNDPLPTRPNFDEADVSDKATWLRDGVPAVTAPFQSYLELDHRNRMGSLLALDELVAAVHARLVTNGELDNTVIVFLSDNGYNLGAHRLAAKQVPYEESIRVPWVMSGPGISPATTATELVTHADLVPTLLDVAGETATDLDGMSVEPLWSGPAPPWRSDLLIEFNGTYSPTAQFHTLADVQAAITAGTTVLAPTYRAVRTDQYLYVEWYDGPPHEYELFDITTDPYQLDNLLVTEPGVHTATAATLQARLDVLKTCAGITCRN